jgi:hypothetical protein
MCINPFNIIHVLNDLIRELNYEEEKIEPNLEEIKISENILEYMLKLVNKNENEFNNSEDLECEVEYQTNFECSHVEYEEFLKENEKFFSDKISFQYMKNAVNLKLEHLSRKVKLSSSQPVCSGPPKT